MRYCKKCVMPDTRPNIVFDENGVCAPCKNFERRKTIDWNKRWIELEKLADKYRGINDNYYDCIITASGGKDSYFQTYIFKEKLNMHPLIVSVNNYSSTETGKKNWDNMLYQFGVDAINLTQSPKINRIMFRKALEKGFPTWYYDYAIYTYPLQMATSLNIPLVIYGENINYEYGGMHVEETPDALNQIKNDVVKPVAQDEWYDKDITKESFACCKVPTINELKKKGISSIYLSYYVPWSGYKNMIFAKNRGFKTLEDTGEWIREGFIEQYDQIDSIGNMTHAWFKFLKFGHNRVTDIASIYVREGRMTREEAVNEVINKDYILDKRMLEEFLSYVGYTKEKFFSIADRFANKNIIEKVDGQWRLKQNVVLALKKGEKVID